MALPHGFRWIKGHQYEQGEPTALALGDDCVARLLQRVDGNWIIRLDCQQPIEAPLVVRRCTSFAQGRAGAELWVLRHEARLRAEVEAKRASRGKNKI